MSQRVRSANITFIYQPKALFNLSNTTQTIKLLPDNDTISYIICFANTNNKVNIDFIPMKYKRMTYNILTAKIYTMAYGHGPKK